MSLIKLTPEEALVQRARIAVCEECEIFSKQQRRCIRSRGGCGCFMDMKTRMMGAKCPRGEWGAMTQRQVIEFAHRMTVDLEIE